MRNLFIATAHKVLLMIFLYASVNAAEVVVAPNGAKKLDG